MAWLIDDVAEATLGPWGLVLGAGVAAAVLARKRLGPLTDTPVAGGGTLGERAREAGERAKTALGGLALTGLPLADRAQTALAEVGEWWTDLYAEARSEWEAGRGHAPTSGGETVDKPAPVAKPRAPRRGKSGRFVKRANADGEA